MSLDIKKAIAKTPEAVTWLVGGEDLVEYLGTAIAKKQATPEQQQYITTEVTRKQALRSAAMVGVAMATVGSFGQQAAIKVAARGASKPIPVPSKFNLGGKSVKVNNPFNATYRPAQPKPPSTGMKITQYK